MEEAQREVSIQHALGDILKPGWAEMDRKFKPIVEATAHATEVNVLFGLVLRITRLAIATDLLSRQGLDEESHVIQRSAVEAYINLCYIFFTGPRRSDVREKDTRDLCLQFCAYGDIAYYKSVKIDADWTRAVFKKHKGMTDAEFDAEFAKWQRLDDEAIRVHGCTKTSWHAMNIQDMSKKVLADPPPFLDPAFCELMFRNFAIANSAVHADSLSIRSQYADHRAGLLALVFKPDVVRGDAVANLAVSTWRAIGWYLSETKWVDKMIERKLRQVLRERWDQAQKPPERTILVPDWLKESP